MVWLPGGGFETGSASIFDGSALAAYEDVLVVTIQYRLGMFGFFKWVSPMIDIPDPQGAAGQQPQGIQCPIT